MKSYLENRFLDVLLSIYLYNEHAGYTQLELLLKGFQQKYPEDKNMYLAIEKHLNDEKRHYQMFKSYFKKLGKEPYQVSARASYINTLVKKIFKKPIKKLNSNVLLNNEKDFLKLCRLIMITERRGIKQVSRILKMPFIIKHPYLHAVFSTIQKDEPSHCYPYQDFLLKHKSCAVGVWEYFADLATHTEMIALRFPLMFFNPTLQRVKFLD